MLRPVIAALAALLLVAACGGASVTTAPSEPPAGLDPEDPWQLTAWSINGEPLEPELTDDARITLVVEGSNVSGESACNQYFGEFTLVGGRVTLGGLGGTEMACAEPIMALETSYLARLAQVDAARMDGQDLVLTGAQLELRFAPLEPPPAAELVATEWVLDSLVRGDAISSTVGRPATLMLDADGSFEASTGCRSLVGRYVVSGDKIEFVELGADGDCGADIVEQDGHVIDVLEGGFRAAVDGQQLRLTGDGDTGLVYRVAE
jgi:heat shock protein HslJ